jgi:hypothetical protein
MYKYLVFIFILFSSISNAQKVKVYQTFKDTRVINSHSTETLEAGKLDVRIGHRFGDLAGDAGGWPTFYGLENASDIMIGLEYGLTDRMLIGINRTKGSGPLKQNINGIYKIKFVNQEKNGNQPLSIAYYGMASYSTMQKSPTEGVLNYFAKPEHRFSYHQELILARKFSNRFSLQVSGAWTYRNIVPSLDNNTIASIGAAAKIQITKVFGLLLEGRLPFSELQTPDNGYYPPLGVAFEFDTGGGHVFQLNFTNATGLAETDYIPYTTSNWMDGEFRLGFTISRLFNI